MKTSWRDRRCPAQGEWAALAAVLAVVIGGCWPLDYSEDYVAGAGAGHFPLGTTAAGPFGAGDPVPRNLAISSAGPYVFADDDGERSRLVLSDALHRTAPRREAALEHVEQVGAAAERAHVTRVSIDEHVRAGAVVLRDYDFQRPAFALLGEQRHAGPAAERRLERYRYQPERSTAAS